MVGARQGACAQGANCRVAVASRNMIALIIACGCFRISAANWVPGIPRNWEYAPSKIEEFPYDASKGAYMVDPWNYTQRLGAYKTLLAESTVLHYGDSKFNNPLWGLPLQFAWQHDTGRLLQGGANGSDRINTSSWWAGMNYMLSIIPFIGGLEAGVVQVPEGAKVIVLPPPPPVMKSSGLSSSVEGTPHFCTSFEECSLLVPNATKGWYSFFSNVRAAENNSKLLSLNSSIKLLWHGHINSLHEGLPLMEPLLDFLPSSQESKFGVSWANLVDFVAALQFDVNFNNTNFLQGMIVPPRLLSSADRAPFIKDFTPAQNRALVVSAIFNEANKATHGGLLRMFKRACCTVKGREDAYGAMIALLEGKGLLTIGDVIKFVYDLVRSHPCPGPGE